MRFLFCWLLQLLSLVCCFCKFAAVKFQLSFLVCCLCNHCFLSLVSASATAYSYKQASFGHHWQLPFFHGVIIGNCSQEQKFKLSIDLLILVARGKSSQKSLLVGWLVGWLACFCGVVVSLFLFLLFCLLSIAPPLAPSI